MQEKEEKYIQLYKTQDKILDLVAKENLDFYLTGGTALQRFHYNQFRFSDDLQNFHKTVDENFNSYNKKQAIDKDISNFKKNLQYYIEKADILIPNTKKDLEEKIKTSFSKLNNFENANIIPKGTLKEALNQKELDLCQKISNQSKTKER
ncbi:hypothetical protein ACM1CG_001826 [Campylobacter coli]